MLANADNTEHCRNPWHSHALLRVLCQVYALCIGNRYTGIYRCTGSHHIVVCLVSGKTHRLQTSCCHSRRRTQVRLQHTTSQLERSRHSAPPPTGSRHGNVGQGKRRRRTLSQKTVFSSRPWWCHLYLFDSWSPSLAQTHRWHVTTQDDEQRLHQGRGRGQWWLDVGCQSGWSYLLHRFRIVSYCRNNIHLVDSDILLVFRLLAEHYPWWHHRII